MARKPHGVITIPVDWEDWREWWVLVVCYYPDYPHGGGITSSYWFVPGTYEEH